MLPNQSIQLNYIWWNSDIDTSNILEINTPDFVISKLHQDIIDILYNTEQGLKNSDFELNEANALFTLEKTKNLRNTLISTPELSQQKSEFLSENLLDLENIDKNTFYIY